MQSTLVTCKACGHPFAGNYCNHCGEKIYTHHDKSVIHLAEESLHFVTHFEGKFFTTLKALLTRPGKLSLDYCNGIRKKYFKPLSFFLLLVVLYLLFPVAKGLNMPLGNHVQSELYGSYARSQALQLMASKHLSEAYLIEHFHTASEKVSKILLVLIIPVMALWCWLLTFKRKDKSYFDHFIFSTEINSFLVLWGFLILPLLTRGILTIISLFTHRDFFSDDLIALVLIATIDIYIFKAARQFYGFTWQKALLFTLLFTALYIAVVQYLYKFLLFFISLKLVH